MNRRTPAIFELAQRLLDREAEHRAGPEALAAATAVVFDRLRGQLTTLIGPAGYHALLSRAATDAAAGFAWLRSVRAEPDGSLVGLETAAADHQTEAADGFATLIAALVDLLISFIGKDLSLHLVLRIWPGELLGEADPGAKEST